MPITRFAKSAARVLLHQGSLLGGVRYWNRNGFRILMYHDFHSAPGVQESHAKQCDHINHYYQVVTLTDIAKHLREGTLCPPNALAVTVDDGGRDFLINAYPVFKAYRIPVTVFLVSGFLDKKLWLWWDQVRFQIEHSRRTSFQLPLSPGRPPVKFDVDTEEQRQQAIETISEALKKLREPERTEILKALPRLLDVELPHDPPSHMAPLDWSAVRHLAENGVDVGAHTVTHPVLSLMADFEEVQQEIGNSKKRIEEELHRPVLHFSYPFGGREHFNDETVKVVEQCQFHTAVTTEPGFNFRGTHPF